MSIYIIYYMYIYEMKNKITTFIESVLRFGENESFFYRLRHSAEPIEKAI